MHPDLVQQVEREIANLGGSVERDPATHMLWVNREFSVSVVLARCHAIDSGRRRWKVRLDSSLAPDISVAARLEDGNQTLRDYYLLPHMDVGLSRISLADQNAAELESYRFETLDYLYGMAARSRLRMAA